MDKKRIALFSCAALVASGIGLNIQNALSDYGIGENSLSLVANPKPVSNSNSNSNSNFNSNWNSNSNSDTLPDMSDSDSNGNGNNENKWKYQSGDCDYEFDENEPGDTVNYSIGGKPFQHVVGNSGHFTHTTVGGKDDCVSGTDYPDCTSTPCPQRTYD